MSSPISKRKRLSGDNVQESFSLFLKKWEELDIDILKKIFARVPIDDLITNVASVCHSWKLACLDVLFWGQNLLDLTPAMAAQECIRAYPMLLFFGREGAVEAFFERIDVTLTQILKRILMDGRDAYGFSLEQWRLSIKSIVIPRELKISDYHLSYLAERTPNIESLVLIGISTITLKGFARALSTWKMVKHLSFGPDPEISNYQDIEPYFTQIVKEIGENCPQLVTLHVKCLETRTWRPTERVFKSCTITPLHLTEYVAKAMAMNLPQVNTLMFEDAELCRDGMNILLTKFAKLESVYFRDCHMFAYWGPSIRNASFKMRSGQPNQKWCFEAGKGSVSDLQNKFKLWMRERDIAFEF